jgi:glucose-1-phosphate thymidylyltransferase
MKGIILAGGSGTRLYPITKVTSKQLIPIYDKPMIYYPLSVLMQAKIKDILIISTKQDMPRFKELLGDGSNYGINLSYEVQPSPDGLAQAFTIGEDFIGDDDVAMILGDNIFYGSNLSNDLLKAKENAKNKKATIFGYHVYDPERFGIVEFDENGNVKSVEEKPENPKSNYAITGLYFYDSSVIEIAKNVQPSERGELEITAVNNEYLKRNQLKVELLGRGNAWLDTGNPSNMLKAGLFVETVQTRQGLYIACIEEIAWRQGLINDEQLKAIGEELKQTDYGKYILSLLEERM